LQEDSLINHIAAKIVENVATTKGQIAQKMVTTEMAQSLWYIFKHSTLDALRITALSVSFYDLNSIFYLYC
jgi:serine/threonine-protein kinase ULK4